MTTRIRKYWLYFSFFYYFALFPLLNWISYGSLQKFLLLSDHNAVHLLGNFNNLFFGACIPFLLAYYFGYKKMGTRWLAFLSIKQAVKLFYLVFLSFTFVSQELITILFLVEFVWLYLCSSLRKFNIEWRQKEHDIPSSLLAILSAMDRSSSFDELSKHYHYAIDLWPHYFQQIHKHFSKIRDRVTS